MGPLAAEPLLDHLGMTGHTSGMKVAISLPDDLCREIDLCAKQLKIPRSRLIADGARVILARYALSEATAAWNAVADAGQPGDEPAVRVLRRRSKQAVRRAAGAW